MQSRSLWKVSVLTSAEGEEAVAEWLEQTFHQTPASYIDAETRAAKVSVYLPSKPLWTAAERTRFASELLQIRAVGLDIGAGRISLTRAPPKRWANSWKRHFKPIEIGSTLLILPSWSRRGARKSQAVVHIDPGLSFGTGQHPTTEFCLRELVARRNSETKQSFLDAGTGSGILAIAAAKLGYAPVEALDFDPHAIRIARANARKNRIAARIHFVQLDIDRLSADFAKQYSVICANLLSDLLLRQCKRLIARVQPGGVLVIAGVLEREFARVQSAYEKAGLKLLLSRKDKEWRSGTFLRAIGKAKCNGNENILKIF